MTLAFGGAAFALSTGQTPAYESEAAIQFNDIARDAGIKTAMELPAGTNPVVKASAESEELRSIDTARKVAKVLKTDISPESLRNAITTNVGAQTFFVQITASWDEAEFAADLVNAYADVWIGDENSQLKEILDTSVEELQPIAKGRLTDDNGNLNLSVFNSTQSAW